MKWIHLCLVLLLLMLPNTTFANTGVFFGAGSQVIPIKNNDIQLVKERVSIKLRIDEEAGKWGIPFFPRADVEAEFYLKNTSKQPIKLQVGFPFLDLQGFGDEKLVLSKLNFRAKDTESDRKVILKEGLIEKELDPQGLFQKVFAWEEQFQPSQTKKITVSYRLLMGVGSANSIMRGFEGTERKYSDLDRLFPALNYSFGYITKTAYTWKEPVVNAVFTIDCTDFFQKLEHADFIKQFGEGFPVGITRPVFLGNFNPSSFSYDKNVYRWEFTGKVPEDGINANFVVLFIPSSSSELPNFLTEKVNALKEGVTKDEYLSVLKGYYARILKKEYEGEKPFTKKYFELVGLLKSELLFEKDQKSLGVAFEKLKAITNKDRL
ncbi:MAG: hypothetical protein HY881_04760 [Deltaproteobacteria bacterium]|nr:hypothetical protein [Deltaproteobacteria bacterium]